jgi:hypothetical protein
MRTGGRNFERTLDVLLPTHIGQIAYVFGYRDLGKGLLSPGCRRLGVRRYWLVAPQVVY